MPGKRLGLTGTSGIAGAGDAHGLIDVAAAGQRVADGTADAGGRTAEGLDLGRVVVGLVLEQEQPVLVLAVRHRTLHLDGAGVDLLGLVEILQDALLLQLLGADGAHVHQADGACSSRPSSCAHVHVAVEGLLHHGVVDLHVVQNGAEGGVAAVIGPVGVDHLDLGDGGVAVLLAEVLLAELRCPPRSMARPSIGDELRQAGLVQLAEAVEHLDRARARGTPCSGSRGVERSLARLHRVDDVVLDGLDAGSSVRAPSSR